MLQPLPVMPQQLGSSSSAGNKIYKKIKIKMLSNFGLFGFMEQLYWLFFFSFIKTSHSLPVLTTFYKILGLSTYNRVESAYLVF